MRRSSPATAWLVLAATLLLWSGNWIVARAVRDDIAPGIATAGRLVVVLLILLPFTFPGLKRKFGQLQGKTVLLAIGLTGGGLHLAFQWLGLHYTTATSATLYLSTAPIFILLLSRPLLGERISARQWIGVAVSFCGVAFIGTQGRIFSGTSVVSFNTGDALAIASMALWGAYTVFLRMRRDALDTPEFLTALCAMGLVTLLPWVAFELIRGTETRLSVNGVVAVLYSAIASLLLAGAGWTYVVKRLGAARAGASMHLMPGIAVLLSMLLLNEYPRWYHGAGIALILAGVALSTSRASSAASSR
ncbi:MAG TPA: DMT family transporter [Burkholderiales bacterium]|jgi:drug/metabolite transporter (DMT)-like permease